MKNTLQFAGVLFAICTVQVTETLPNVALRPGQTFEVKLNLTSKPDDISFVRFENLRNQLFIKEILIHYISFDGVIDNADRRVSLFGKAEEGEAWFMFKNISTTDSGTYGVLYKMMDSPEILNKTFTLTVTKVPIKKERPTVPDVVILTWNPSTETPTESRKIIIARKKSKGTEKTTKGFKVIFVFIIISLVFMT